MTESTTRFQIYIVGIPDGLEGEWSEPVVVSAESPEQAVRLAHPNEAAEDPEWIAGILGGETDYRVERYPAADALATEAKVIRDESLLRPFGWHYSDERQCQECEEWSESTCQECDLCPACRGGGCENCRDENPLERS